MLAVSLFGWRPCRFRDDLSPNATSGNGVDIESSLLFGRGGRAPSTFCRDYVSEDVPIWNSVRFVELIRDDRTRFMVRIGAHPADRPPGDLHV